jgi:hypothetical protein
MMIIFCIILSLIFVPSIKANCLLQTTELPNVGAGIGLTGTTTAAWIQKVEGVNGCYNPKRMGYEVLSNKMIDSTKTNFDSYFTAFIPLRFIPNAAACCSKCGASGAYSKCVGFDYNDQTKTCQMYAIKVQDAFYLQDGVEIHYDKLEAQADDLKSFTAAVSQGNRWSGVYIDGTGNLPFAS